MSKAAERRRIDQRLAPADAAAAKSYRPRQPPPGRAIGDADASALVGLAGASIWLPYKASKVRSYWPAATPTERRVLLYRQWSEIVTLLERQVAGVAAALPSSRD